MFEGNLKVTIHIPALIPIPEDVGPNYINLTLIQIELNSNAMSITSSQSGKCRLFFAQSASAYVISYHVATFPTRANPGRTPAHSRGASSNDISEKNWHHPLLCQYHANYQTCGRCLETILLDYLPEIFLEEQKDETLGFGDKTTLVLLTYMWVTYGEINDVMLANNLQRIKAPCSPYISIEQLFCRIKSCISFVTKGCDHITKASLAHIGVSII